jgi:putative oxidoreductase
MSGSTVNCQLPAPEDSARHFCGLSAAFSLACRYLLAAVFLMAAVSKITDLQAFTDRLVLHSGLAYRPASIVAAVLPWLELTCGLCLALGVAVREAAAIVCMLLVMFLGYSVWHHGETDCGCFLFPHAVPLTDSGWWQPVRNGLLTVCALRVARKS